MFFYALKQFELCFCTYQIMFGESLSCYAVYSPRMATTVEADRTCISNIHQGGTPPVEAAAVIVDLAKRMLEQKASGINMTR